MPDIKIRISAGQKTAGTGAEPQEDSAVAKKDTTKNAVVSIFAHQMLATGKQALSTSVSLIGIETGGYGLQQAVEQVVGLTTSAIGTGVAFATNPILGVAKMMGDIASYGMKMYVDYRKYQVSERNADVLRRRSGNSLTNGSRTGD